MSKSRNPADFPAWSPEEPLNGWYSLSPRTWSLRSFTREWAVLAQIKDKGNGKYHLAVWDRNETWYAFHEVPIPEGATLHEVMALGWFHARMLYDNTR